MAYCPNCGGVTEEGHNYCMSCGENLSEDAESVEAPSRPMSKGGFLSLHSISYLNALLTGERELDQDSASYVRLAEETSAAFADFAQLSMVDGLDLLQLWAAGTNSVSASTSIDDMDVDEFQDYLSVMGLSGTLRMYDESLYTELEDEFNDQLQKLLEFAKEDEFDE